MGQVLSWHVHSSCSPVQETHFEFTFVLSCPLEHLWKYNETMGPEWTTVHQCPFRLWFWLRRCVHMNQRRRQAGRRNRFPAEQEETRVACRRKQRADQRCGIEDVGARYVGSRETVPRSQRTIGIDGASFDLQPGTAVVDAFGINHLSERDPRIVLFPFFNRCIGECPSAHGAVVGGGDPHVLEAAAPQL